MFPAAYFALFPCTVLLGRRDLVLGIRWGFGGRVGWGGGGSIPIHHHTTAVVGVLLPPWPEHIWRCSR